MPGGLRVQTMRVQLQDRASGENIIAAGGKVQVCIAGSARKAAIVDESGAALANPFVPTRGFIEFNVGETVTAVDLYIQEPNGSFIVARGILPSGPNEIKPTSADRLQVMTLPFHWADLTPGAEKDTGFTIPTRAVFAAPAMIETKTANAGATITCGTLASEGGSATVFSGPAKSVAAQGVLLGAVAPAENVGGRKISMTLSAGANVAEGFIYVPILLAVA